jgi:hypothetical protein
MGGIRITVTTVGLARTVYIQRVRPYIWWFPCQKYHIYTVYIWLCPTLTICSPKYGIKAGQRSEKHRYHRSQLQSVQQFCPASTRHSNHDLKPSCRTGRCLQSSCFWRLVLTALILFQDVFLIFNCAEVSSQPVQVLLSFLYVLCNCRTCPSRSFSCKTLDLRTFGRCTNQVRADAQCWIWRPLSSAQTR